ncbi:hypothetical protein Tco_0373070, partial [Tanacetum coccineum]
MERFIQPTDDPLALVSNASNQKYPTQSSSTRMRTDATNFDDDMDDLALNVDHVFEADQCNAFDSDVDEAPTIQTNLYGQSTMKPGHYMTRILRL